MWSESSAWRNSKPERPIKSSGLYPTSSATLETAWEKKTRSSEVSFPLSFALQWNGIPPASHPRGGRSKVEIGYIFPSHLPSQWVKRRSMLWRVRKVQVSRGNSTLDGCGMGSHSRVMTLPAGGDAEPLPKGQMWPVQWRTWRKRARNLKQSSSTKHASNNRNKLLFLLNFMLLSCSELLLMKSIQFVLLCFCQC